MIREISILNKELVNDDKSGFLSHVSKSIKFTDEKMFKCFPELLTNFHVSFSTFRDNQKNKSAFIQTSFLVYDFDNGTLSQMIHDNILDISHFIVGSKNHLKDKEDGKGIIERFHVIIPLEEELTDTEFFKYVWKDIEKHKLKAESDKSCCDVTKYFYKHSHVLFVHNASFLSTKHLKYPYIIEKNLSEAMFKKPKGKRTFDERNKYYKLLYDLKAGNRNNNCCILVGAMINCGMTKKEIKKTISPYVYFDKSFTESKLERIINDFMRSR